MSNNTQPTTAPVLSVLIPSLHSRANTLDQLLLALHDQVRTYDTELQNVQKFTVEGCSFKRYQYGRVELLVAIDEKKLSIGKKRNALVANAKGLYCSQMDDDDLPGNNYIHGILYGVSLDNNPKQLELPPDACSLRGVITTDGQTPEIFEHHQKYLAWRTVPNAEVKYERYINHLNAIRRDILLQIPFADKSHGEDHDFSERLLQSGLIKTVSEIPGIIYHYRFNSQK